MKQRCMKCGSSFEGRANQDFCSKRCRQNYYKSNVLILPMKGKWFWMILDRIKPEEYREMKPYWEKRFLNYFGQVWDFDSEEPRVVWSKQKKTIVFRNGYGSDKPEFRAECTIEEGYGKEEWGAVPGEKYYVLKVHRIFGEKNCERGGLIR